MDRITFRREQMAYVVFASVFEVERRQGAGKPYSEQTANGNGRSGSTFCGHWKTKENKHRTKKNQYKSNVVDNGQCTVTNLFEHRST